MLPLVHTARRGVEGNPFFHNRMDNTQMYPQGGVRRVPPRARAQDLLKFSRDRSFS